MPHKEVKKAIDELNVELKQIPKETGVLEGILEQAREGIERYTPEAVQDLLETLQRESDEFEAEHPRVTALINQLTNALTGLGI
jgi:ABC-type transporter Mla subunit MlaD